MKNNIKGKTIFNWAKELFPLNRSLTGNGNMQTLNFLKSKLNNFKILKFQSGKKVYDWKIPKVWEVKSAMLLDDSGKKILDFKDNNLHLVGYSKSFKKIINFKILKKHLHYIKNLPDAIPYVTSYYKEYWGFCLSFRQFKQLKKNINYLVNIKTTFKKGNLIMGELKIPGNSKKEILLSTNICHPSMGNNETSGIVVTLAIAMYLQSLKKRNYSYRILFLPETIGSISYISKNLSHLKKNVIGGLNIVCVGDNNKFSFLPSKKGNSVFEKMILNSLKKTRKKFKQYSFLNRGSDERQYCSAGVDLPICSVMRSKYGAYKEYHTSFDDLNFISPKGLVTSFEFIKKILNNFEKKEFYVSTLLCEPFLSKYGLYHSLSSKLNYERSFLIRNILTYCDGNNDLEFLSKTLKIGAKKLRKIIKKLERLKLLKKL